LPGHHRATPHRSGHAHPSFSSTPSSSAEATAPCHISTYILKSSATDQLRSKAASQPAHQHSRHDQQRATVVVMPMASDSRGRCPSLRRRLPRSEPASWFVIPSSLSLASTVCSVAVRPVGRVVQRGCSEHARLGPPVTRLPRVMWAPGDVRMRPARLQAAARHKHARA
jgi:hypothetical protein